MRDEQSPPVIGNCTSVQLTQLDHERGASGGAGCQRISAETWIWQNNQYSCSKRYRLKAYGVVVEFLDEVLIISPSATGFWMRD